MIKENEHPKLTLVGAGIGDPDLITLKGIKALKQAKVVLYDALVSEELLEYASPEAELVFVGKRVGMHSYKQEEINKLIVSYAFSKGHVVRLKGGDPYIFGRGHEELTYARKFGISVNYVPGISSSIAAAGLQHIPLTRRHVSESLWVLTGTTKDEQVSSDIHLAAKSTATIVILMGTRKLRQIMEVFAGEGKSETPVAIIQNSSMANEKVVLGTVDTIVEEAAKEQVASPAVIVVGEVVRMHQQYPEKLQELVAQAV
ncbi:uroporphyrinogen-III C-methyltransferase [Algivirga pacifica]|uniref:uroporphyrinogen-III C-methyltransferase n=1 Tax=Algivirga pacifica TaxID=1162670 RepID=A0ABP9DDS7_9BACT